MTFPFIAAIFATWLSLTTLSPIGLDSWYLENAVFSFFCGFFAGSVCNIPFLIFIKTEWHPYQSQPLVRHEDDSYMKFVDDKRIVVQVGTPKKSQLEQVYYTEVITEHCGKNAIMFTELRYATSWIARILTLTGVRASRRIITLPRQDQFE